MGFFKPLGQLCNPSKVYLAISVITILSSLMTGSIFGIIFHAITVLLWAFFLGWLCDEGHGNVAWFLVLALPILMFIIIVVGLVFFFSHPASKRADMLDNIKSTSASEATSDEADDDKKSSEGFYY